MTDYSVVERDIAELDQAGYVVEMVSETVPVKLDLAKFYWARVQDYAYIHNAANWLRRKKAREMMEPLRRCLVVQ